MAPWNSFVSYRFREKLNKDKFIKPSQQFLTIEAVYFKFYIHKKVVLTSSELLIQVGEGGKWTATITNSNNISKLDAVTKPECVYKICEGLLGSPPSFLNFIKWFCYPVHHPEISRMTANLEHILELLPLQNFIDRQLFTNRVQVTLEVHLSINNARFTITTVFLWLTAMVCSEWVFISIALLFYSNFFRNIFIVSIMRGNIMQLKMKTRFGSSEWNQIRVEG